MERTDTLAGTTEPAEDETSTLEPPSAFMNAAHNLQESSSPGKIGTTTKKLSLESPRRRKIDGGARVLFLGTLSEEEWEDHHGDHENRTGCDMDRVAFMEVVWTVVLCYVTQSTLKTGLNRPLMRETLGNLDKCEGRMSELLIDSATGESETNSPIKMTHQESNEEVMYLSRTRKRTMLSMKVIDKINDMKIELGSKVTLRKTGKAKVDSEPATKTANSAKRKRVEDAIDMGQGDYGLPGISKMMTNVAMVPPMLMVGLRSASFETKRIDRTLTEATLEVEIFSQCDESTPKDFKPSCMNHGKRSVSGQLTPVEHNRLTVSDTVSIDEPAGGYMEIMDTGTQLEDI